MAVTYGFFNSVNGDRKYNADTMSEFYTGICTQGVFQHVDNGLAVSAGTGLTVNVASGRAIIQGHWVKNDAALTLSIDAASATYARIDAVVIRYSASNRNIQIVVKTGTPAASPSAPSMTRAGGVYELCLAYVNVAANATSVTVTDKRSNSSVCGWAAVAQATSGEVDQMLNDMKTGFDGVTYSSPAAMVQGSDTKLQNEIDSMKDAVNAADEMFVESSEPAKTNVTNTAFFTKVADTSSDVGAGKIWLTSNANFDTYVCILENDADIYVDPSDVAYVALCYGYNYTSTVGNEYYCSNPARKRNIDGNLPTTAETAISLSAGDIIVISVTKNQTVNVYGLETNYDFSTYAKSKILEISASKKPCAIYNGTTTGQETERIYIYIPCGVGYIRFNFAHYVYAASNANVWVIHPVYAVDDSLTTRFALTTSGEFECALRIDGAPDFMGGSSHGSEIMQSIEFFVDGAKTDPDDITSLTTFDELRIVEQSKLFDPRDETTYAALHGKEYIFTKEKLIINQTIVWQTSETLGQGYLAMLPVAKTVTSKIATDNNYDPISFPAAGITADGVDMALSWDDTVGFSVRFSKERWDITGSNLTNVGRFLETDNNGGEYNKQYFICSSAGSVSSGDMWKTTTQYVFEINK